MTWKGIKDNDTLNFKDIKTAYIKNPDFNKRNFPGKIFFSDSIAKRTKHTDIHHVII